MTGRQAYEMFTRAFGPMSGYVRKEYIQFGNTNLIAYDDLTWQEQGAWKNIARQVDRRIARSVAARKAKA